MFNIVILTGRLTSDAELKTTPNGIAVTGFSIAVQRRQKNADGEYDTDFINVVAWRNTAEFITKYFKKGSLIGIEGSIQTRKYVDKNGNNRTVFEVVANNVQFIEGKKETATQEPMKESDFIDVSNDDSDLPF